MAEERAAFEASCAEYGAKKAELMQKVQQQQTSVRQVLESALLPGPEWDGRCDLQLMMAHQMHTE